MKPARPSSAKGGQKPAAPAQSTVSDPRFARVHRDPRFAQLPKKERKFQVDERFGKMFNDPKFKMEFMTDKYGRRIKSDKAGDDLRRFYSLKGEDEQQDDAEVDDESDVPNENAVDHADASDDQSDEENAVEDAASEEEDFDPARGRGRGPADTDSDTSDSELSVDAAEYEETELALARQSLQTNVKLGDESKRIAVMHLEWDRIRAVDLFVLFQSFVPNGGSLKRVAVFASDYGIEKMAEESRLGPKSAVATTESAETNEGESSSDGEHGEESENDEEDDDDIDDDELEDEVTGRSQQKKPYMDEWDVDGAADQDALRKYELEKLKYYYAVVECDSVATASKLYDECDGQEYQRSSNMLDLRFIPDDFKLPDRDPRDECREVPSNYKPPEFYTKALQHTKVELTWEMGDQERSKALTRDLTNEEVRLMDFQNFLGSESEDGGSGSDVAISVSGSDEDDDSDDDEDGKHRVYLKKKARNKYANLLTAIQPEESEQEDMEITFVPGLKDVGKKMLEEKRQKEATKDETVWEKYQRERGEKKKARRKERRDGKKADDKQSAGKKSAGKFADSDDGSEDDAAVDPNDDEFFADAFTGDNYQEGESDDEVVSSRFSEKKESKQPQKKQKKSKEEIAEEKRQRAQLELLMMDDDADKRKKGFSLKNLIELNKVKSGEKKAKHVKGDLVEDDFRVNTNDDRFSRLFRDPQFAIDTTDPRFKKTQGMQELLQTSQQRRIEANAEKEAEVRARKAQRRDSASAVQSSVREEAPASSNAHLASLVQSVKQKSNQFSNIQSTFASTAGSKQKPSAMLNKHHSVLGKRKA